jgi:hypothetical protein
VLEHASLQVIEDYVSAGASKYARVPQGERIDAPEGTIIGIQPGMIIDSFKNRKRFLVAEDSDLVELPDEGWATILTASASALRGTRTQNF